MTAPVLKTLEQKLAIDAVMSVIVTEEVDDGTSSGTWVREIRIFAEPLGQEGVPVLTVQIRSSTRANIEIATPTLTF